MSAPLDSRDMVGLLPKPLLASEIVFTLGSYNNCITLGEPL